MAEQVLTLKDMTRGSGCTPRTVRYYERQGLLRALRSAGGHRLFPAVELERLNFIISLREAGWSLEEVTSFLALRASACSDGDAVASFEALLQEQMERLQQKIEILQGLRKDLESAAPLLRVCHECTSKRERIDCSACDRMPNLEHLPRSFRLVWRARELGEAPPYDEMDAASDLDDADAEG